MVKTIIPESKEHWLQLRSKNINSTEVAALFHCSPYITEFELWHRKKENISVDFEPTERVVWGTRLESAIANGIAEDNGLKIRQMKEYIFDEELRLGSSFDFAIEPDGILEIKNVDGLAFRDGWTGSEDDGSVEAPIFIEFQVQNELLVSSKKYALIGAFVGGNKTVLLRREPNLKVFEAIKAKVAAFWKSVDENVPPQPDFSRDVDTISKLYGYAEPGKVFDGRGNESLSSLMDKYKKTRDAAKEAEAARDAIKAECLTLIGDAEKVLGDGWSISAGIVGPAHIEYDRPGYRTFRPNFRKEK